MVIILKSRNKEIIILSKEKYYNELAEKLDGTVFGLSVGEQGNISETWMEYLKELIPEEDIKYIVKLNIYPFMMSIKRFARKIDKLESEAKEILDRSFNNDYVMRIHSKSKSKKFEYAIHLPFLLFDAPVLNFQTGYSNEKKEKIAKLSLKFLEEEGWYHNFEGGPKTPLSRIIPVQKSIPTQSKILPYENVIQIIEDAKVLSLHECACRARLQAVGRRKCTDKYPLETCIGVNQGGQYVIDRGKGREISKEEAKELLMEFNKLGLVHTTENFQDGDHMILCSCCSCCCNLIGGITKLGWDNPRAIASSNYIAEIFNPDECTNCKICIAKCPFKAISSSISGLIVINKEKCMGCGVCVVNCPSQVIKLKRLEREIIYKNQVELGLKISQETNRKIKL